MGKLRKQGGENALNSNLAGKHIFLAGHPFTWQGSVSAGSLLGGVTKSAGVWQHFLCFMSLPYVAVF